METEIKQILKHWSYLLYQYEHCEVVAIVYMGGCSQLEDRVLLVLKILTTSHELCYQEIMISE